MTQSPCFGIDLGTSTSAIAYLDQGVPTLIDVDGNTFMLPSAACFLSDGSILVGQPALNALEAMPERTVVSAKRKMGSEHHWDIPDHGRITPIDLATLVLERLLDIAEERIGIRPQRAVITVPAWFTEAQRTDTRTAGERAGLVVERIINEPTAAALAHAHKGEGFRRVLVYDLGGGTFDVSLVEQTGPVVEVRASHGDSELGGDDVDVLLRDRVLNTLDQDSQELVDAIAGNPGSMLRLKAALEKVKIALSEDATAWLTVPYITSLNGQPQHIELELKRGHLDWAADFVIQRSFGSVDQVLKDAGVQASDIDELLLVGGSTYLPKVWQDLRSRYGLEGSHAVHPRKAVVLGAAIQAAMIDGLEVHSMLLDVAPYSISVGVSDPRASTGKMHFVSQVITPRNTPIPSHHTEVFYTAGVKQTTFRLPVFQGSHNDPRQNVFLGQIEFDDLPAESEVEARPIHVEFRHDLDGRVDITITDAISRRSQKGQLAADGAQQVALRDAWLETMLRNDVILGDGDVVKTSAAPLEARDPRRAELDDDFHALLAAEARVRSEFPEHADRLLDLARTGLANSREDAEETADALADLMFDIGLYLDD